MARASTTFHRMASSRPTSSVSGRSSAGMASQTLPIALTLRAGPLRVIAYGCCSPGNISDCASNRDDPDESRRLAGSLLPEFRNALESTPTTPVKGIGPGPGDQQNLRHDPAISRDDTMLIFRCDTWFGRR